MSSRQRLCQPCGESCANTIILRTRIHTHIYIYIYTHTHGAHVPLPPKANGVQVGDGCHDGALWPRLSPRRCHPLPAPCRIEDRTSACGWISVCAHAPLHGGYHSFCRGSCVCVSVCVCVCVCLCVGREDCRVSVYQKPATFIGKICGKV